MDFKSAFKNSSRNCRKNTFMHSMWKVRDNFMKNDQHIILLKIINFNAFLQQIIYTKSPIEIA
jgi:hypothetical protein